jgi:hypothetical protein
MRFMSWVRSDRDFGEPPRALTDAIAQAGAEGFANGTLLDTGGISTIQAGGRAKLAGGKLTITDGPFIEAKELVGGFAIQNFSSREQALESARWMLDLHKEHWPEWEGEIEIRQLSGPEDF